MEQEKPRTLSFNLNQNPKYDTGLVCGGTLDIFVEPVLPVPVHVNLTHLGVLSETEKLSVNADGRVGIPDRLASFAGLHQELVLVGIDDHFEVWDAGRWRQYTQQKGAGHTTVAAEQD